MRKLKTPGNLAAVPPPDESKPNAVETSRKLVDAMEKADKEERISAARAAVFENANAAKERPMTEPMRRIIESQFLREEDIVREHRELEERLKTSNKVGHQAHELEESEVNARRAFKLWITFKQMTLEWEMDNRVVFTDMREQATKALQREKEQGYRSKQITDADVSNMMATMFPDEWRAQEIKRSRAHSTEKSLEHLVEMWGAKVRSLGTLVGRGR